MKSLTLVPTLVDLFQYEITLKGRSPGPLAFTARSERVSPLMAGTSRHEDLRAIALWIAAHLPRQGADRARPSS